MNPKQWNEIFSEPTPRSLRLRARLKSKLPDRRKAVGGDAGHARRANPREDEMASARENLATWLRDAYAMEGQAIELLESQIQRLENYPEAQPRLRQHLGETKEQQAAVEQCLERLGESPSGLKEATMRFGANMQGMMRWRATRCSSTRSAATPSSSSRPAATAR
jgi:hypothetical protein